jgi:hypothetical protein
MKTGKVPGVLTAPVVALTVPAGAQPSLRAYLARLDSAMPLAGRPRRRILAEVADGLQCAVDEHLAGGATAADAGRAAVAEFGDPADLGRMFTREQARSLSHRVGLGLVVTGPAVGLAWMWSYAAASGRGLADEIGTRLATTAWLAPMLVLSVGAAIVAIAGAGRLGRVFRVQPSTAIAAAGVATMACLAADVMLLAAGLTGGTHALVWLGILASTVRIGAVLVSGRRCLRLRAGVS